MLDASVTVMRQNALWWAPAGNVFAVVNISLMALTASAVYPSTMTPHGTVLQKATPTSVDVSSILCFLFWSVTVVEVLQPLRYWLKFLLGLEA